MYRYDYMNKGKIVYLCVLRRAANQTDAVLQLLQKYGTDLIRVYKDTDRGTIYFYERNPSPER